MSSIKDLTYQQLKEHKRIFENALRFAFTDFDRKAIGLTIEGIQAEMDRRNRKTVLSMVIAVNILMVVTIILGGCAKVLEGSGRIIEGLGDGIVAGGIHLQESSSSKD